MKKRIRLGMCIIAFFSVLVTSILTVLVLYEDKKTDTEQNLKSEANYIKEVYVNSGLQYVKSMDDISNSRVIIFGDTDEITVLYDSSNKDSSIDGVYRSSEIEKTRKHGEYTCYRYSSTTNSDTIYYYLQLDSGDIVRTSQEISNIFADLITMFPWLIIIVLVALVVSVFLSKIQTNRIIEPLDKIDLDADEIENVYDELVPMIKKMARQKREIKKTLTLLENRQQEFNAIIKYMSEGFVITDKNGDVLSFNQSALNLSGYNGDFEIGRSVFRMNKDVDFYCAVEDALLGKSIEFMQHINGKYCKYLISPVQRGDYVAGAIIVIMDSTEVEKREEMRREFTANVSHELKTPLTSISGYAEIIKAGIAKEKDIKGFAEKIYTEAQRLIDLVADIIKISRLDESSDDFVKENVDVYAIAKSAMSRLEFTAQNSKIKLDIKGKSSNCYCVPNLIEEMIFNLCDNAIKYNNEGGFVSLLVNKYEDKTLIVIEDNGIGIPKEDQNRIFERFYRVDKSHSKATGGTGLGLSIVKHCVKLHSGEISLVSDEGKGTKITIKI